MSRYKNNKDGTLSVIAGAGDTSALANKADISDLRITGTTNTSGNTISAGTYFYLNGSLVKAKLDIASNAQFTLGTNYENITVGREFTSLTNKLPSKIPTYRGYLYGSYTSQDEFDDHEATYYFSSWTTDIKYAIFNIKRRGVTLGYYLIETKSFGISFGQQADNAFDIFLDDYYIHNDNKCNIHRYYSESPTSMTPEIYVKNVSTLSQDDKNNYYRIIIPYSKSLRVKITNAIIVARDEITVLGTGEDTSFDSYVSGYLKLDYKYIQ